MRPYFESAPNRYCRLFAPLHLNDPDRRDALVALGGAMLDREKIDGSLRDSGYTYFGQFIDHDLTSMDPLPVPFWRKIWCRLFGIQTVSVKRDLRNLQTPRLDLSHLYGGGPFDPASKRLYNGVRLKIGPRGGSGCSFDVRVDDTTKEPIVADGRSRENLMIRQIVAVFSRLHNAAVKQWQSKINDQRELFEQARKQTVWQFQYLVVNDYLGKILDSNVFTKVFEEGRPSFEWRTTFSIPVEFAVAAFRFGHSMVRPRYLFSAAVNPPLEVCLDKILDRAVQPCQLEDEWEIKWGCFFEGAGQVDQSTGQSDSIIVHAQPIDTLVAKPLHELSDRIIRLFPVSHLKLATTPFADEFKLPVRTLLRGESMALCSGQKVACRFKERRLTVDELMKPRDPDNPHGPILQRAQLLEHTPLWYYILKESELSPWDGSRLGLVGSHIVAETISAALRYDRTSFFWNPEPLGTCPWRTRNRVLSPPVWRIGNDQVQIFTLMQLFGYASQLPAD